MTNVVYMLFSVYLLFSSGKPVPHAVLSCRELIGVEDDYETDFGYPITSDSAGRLLVESSYFGVFHCRAWDKKGTVSWEGELDFEEKWQTFEVVLK